MENKDWDIIITPQKKWWQLQLGELLKSRDLLWLLFRRDVVSVYKQTLLGPLWFFIQPVLSSFAFTIILSGFGKLSTDGMPPFLFYLSGMVPWNYFASVVQNNSNTFYQNQNVFGKVYFPRLLMPFSLTLSNLLKFSLQFILFLGVWFWFLGSPAIQPNMYAFLLPLNLLAITMLGLGTGLILSSLSIRFRDINFIVGFFLQLAMYVSSVIIPVSMAGKYQWVILANPMTPLIESFKYGFLGVGYMSAASMAYSYLAAMVLFFVGILAFKKAENTFIDKI